MSKQTSQPVIKFADVSLQFSQKEIFDHLNLTINSGEKVVIFGKSGIGKSSLLKLILGFVRPDSGDVYILDKKVCSNHINWVRTKVAYVDQDVMIGEGQAENLINEYFSFQANQQLTVSRKKVLSLMTEFELPSTLLQQNIQELSGGERQRLALVIALLLKRPIILLDEVTASLDPTSKKIVIANLLKQKDLTAIIVTHDQEWKKLPQVKLFDFKDQKWIR